MTAMIEVRNLCKRFGKLVALDDLTLTVNAGDIHGFIGPNGAGKSTTFKMLTTILLPDTGSITINGIDIKHGDAVRSIIGYMPDIFGVYEDMTVYQYLDFFGAAYYIHATKRKNLISDILDLTDLAFKKDAMVQSLSRGMQQRLGIARVLIHDPKLLILDEPASGLDPRARVELRELLKELAGMGKTILISSHILSELSEICNRMSIIEQGKLIFEGSRQELNHKLLGHFAITIKTVQEDFDKAFRLLQDAPFVDQVRKSENTLLLKMSQTPIESHEILTFLIEKGCRILTFHTDEPSLEDAFMTLTKGKLA